MRRAFIRGLWGIQDHQERRFYKRRSKIDGDIELLKHCKYNEPFMTYVFGEENFRFLKSQGFRAKLIDKEPIVWDMDKKQFRHKLEVIRRGLQDYDEVVFLDWDQLPVTKLPEDFWEVMGQKEPIQAILRMYHRRKAEWRKSEQRQIPCASFVYVRGKEVGEDLVNLWSEMGEPWSEETVIAKYMDDRIGGWKGADEYWKLYEPDFFVLTQGRVFSRELLATKRIAFDHFNMNDVSRELKLIKSGRLKDWQI